MWRGLERVFLGDFFFGSFLYIVGKGLERLRRKIIRDIGRKGDLPVFLSQTRSGKSYPLQDRKHT